MKKEEKIKLIFERIKQDNDGIHIDFLIPDYASKKLKAVQSMINDIKICTLAANKLLDEDYDTIVSTSLHNTIIILYGKCFTDSSKAKLTKLEPKDCFDSESMGLIETHGYLMDLRHNFVAHRGNSDHEASLAYLKLNSKNYSRQIRVRQIKLGKPKSSKLKLYLILFEHIMEVLNKMFRKESSKVFDHLLQEYKPEELAKLKIAGPIAK